jgi:hypothetical protein
MKNYIAQNTGWISNIHYEQGDTVVMSEAQAEYYVLNGQLKLQVVAAQAVALEPVALEPVASAKKAKA